MTQQTVALREMTAADSKSLVELALASPDTGQIQISPVFHLDAYESAALMNPDFIGVVAALPGSGQVVGSAFVTFSKQVYRGESRDCAWLHGLQVHPSYRRQKIATQLASWRVSRGRARVGEGGIIGASIQKGNSGSFAVAQTWCTEVAGDISAGVVGMRNRPPRVSDRFRVRQATDSDLGRITARLNEFYSNYDFYTPQTDSSLAEWLDRTPFDDPFRAYFIAENTAKEIVAGMAIAEDHRIMEMQVQHLSVPLRLLNRVVKLVPQDGRMRQLSALKAWFSPGQLKAAQYLWEIIRWERRKRGSTLGFALDPRSPLKDVFRTPFWIPTTSLTYVVSSPIAESLSKPRLIYAG